MRLTAAGRNELSIRAWTVTETPRGPDEGGFLASVLHGWKRWPRVSVPMRWVPLTEAGERGHQGGGVAPWG